MKLRIAILMVIVAACAAYGQAPKPASPANKKPAPAASSAPKARQPQAAKPAANTARPKPAAPARRPALVVAKPAVPAAKPAAQNQAPKPRKVQAKKKAETAAPAAAPTATEVNTAAPVAASRHSAGKRDPFVSPVRDRNNEPVNCGSGKRCLVPSQTILRGVVKAPSGMIAVVCNSQDKAYFLRENDPVYNGYVLHITPNSVVFRETVEDRLGRKSTREVVKKVNAPVV